MFSIDLTVMTKPTLSVEYIESEELETDTITVDSSDDINDYADRLEAFLKEKSPTSVVEVGVWYGDTIEVIIYVTDTNECDEILDSIEEEVEAL